MKSVVFLDLDETLVAQERAFSVAFAAVADAAHRETAEVTDIVQRRFAETACADVVRRCRFGGRDILWADPGDDTEAERQIAVELAGYRSAVWSDLGDAKLGATFAEQMKENESLYSDVLPLLRALDGRARIAVITNGMQAAQQRKLERLGLTAFVERLFASTLVGVGKPARRIFDYALREMGVEPAQALMVGDSLHGDIAGAQAAGIEAAWIRRDPRVQADPTVRPDAEFADLVGVEALI